MMRTEHEHVVGRGQRRQGGGSRTRGDLGLEPHLGMALAHALDDELKFETRRSFGSFDVGNGRANDVRTRLGGHVIAADDACGRRPQFRFVRRPIDSGERASVGIPDDDLTSWSDRATWSDRRHPLIVNCFDAGR